MPYSGKAEQRLAGSLNYKASESTLTSSSVKGPKDMGNKKPDTIYGTLSSGGGNAGLYRGALYGCTDDGGSPSGITGTLAGAGFPSGPRWKRAMEPGELKPGKASQAKNTVRMTPGKGDKSTVMKSTGTTPKALRGGGRGPR